MGAKLKDRLLMGANMKESISRMKKESEGEKKITFAGFWIRFVLCFVFK